MPDTPDTPDTPDQPVGDDRPSVYLEDIDGTQHVIYRASAVGGCERALIAARIGAPRHPIPAVIQKAFDEGHAAEAAILDRFAADHADHLRLLPNGGTQRQVAIPVTWPRKAKASLPVLIRGSLDGLAIGTTGEFKGEKIVVDAKAFATSTFDQMLRDPTKIKFWDHYITQQTVYARGVGANWAVLAIVEKIDGKVGVESRVHYHWINVTREQGRWDELVAIVRRVEQTVKKIGGKIEAGQLGEEQKEVQATPCPCDYACQYPQFHTTNDDTPEIQQRDLDRYTEMLDIDQRIRETEAQLKADKDRRKELAVALVDEYGQKFRGQGFKVTWVRQEVAEQTRVVKAHVREYPKITKDKDAGFSWD